MAVTVSAFTAMARAEFQNAMMEVHDRIFPAAYDNFVMKYPSNVAVETHTYMSQIPRLREFKGYTPGQRLVNTPWTVPNITYRAGPIVARKEDLDDEQTGGYINSINSLPAQAQKDIGYKILSTLAAGTTNLCFDGTAMFADSHTVGSGDNLMTADNSGNDGVTHYIIALITDGPAKPMLFQDREPLSALETDADTPQGKLLREYQYWADCRFGVSCAAWFAGIHMTITDTPSLTELMGHIRDITDRFRTFTLPKGADVDDSLYVHEGWVPQASNFTLLCNMKLGSKLNAIAKNELIAAGTSGATITNELQGTFNLIPTSALGA